MGQIFPKILPDRLACVYVLDKWKLFLTWRLTFLNWYSLVLAIR